MQGNKSTSRETVRTKYDYVKENDTHFVYSKLISIVLTVVVGPMLNEMDVSNIRFLPRENQEVLTAFILR
jgi:hypothetical protein